MCAQCLIDDTAVLKVTNGATDGLRGRVARIAKPRGSIKMRRDEQHR